MPAVAKKQDRLDAGFRRIPADRAQSRRQVRHRLFLARSRGGGRWRSRLRIGRLRRWCRLFAKRDSLLIEGVLANAALSRAIGEPALSSRLEQAADFLSPGERFDSNARARRLRPFALGDAVGQLT